MEQVSQSLNALVEAFLLNKRVSGCTAQTLETYDRWFKVVLAEMGEVPDSLAMHRFFSGLHEKQLAPSTIHQAYRSLRTFFLWAKETGHIAEYPLRGIKFRTPKTLPDVPTEEEIRQVLKRCPKTTFPSLRNRAILLTLADSGLRASELLHLLVENWNPQERSLFVRSGKGQKDRVVFISPVTVRALRDYLAMRTLVAREDFLFVDGQNRPLKLRHLLQTLHRLSDRAGLPANRRLHPHALRHFAATSWLRNGVGLDEVRRLLGHESLSTTLRYSSLVSADLQHAHKKAGAIERMGLD